MPFNRESAARQGAKGGRKRSAAKRAHARANGAKGGRPIKLPPVPEGIKPPAGATSEEARAHAHKFAEYYALLAVARNAIVQPTFTDEEILQTLRRMKRYDLVSKRRNQLRQRTRRDQRNIERMAARLDKL